MGSRLIPLLAGRGHAVAALVRPGSEAKVPPGCRVVTGDALDADTFAVQVPPADTLVQLVGVAHPSPAVENPPAGIRIVDVPGIRGASASRS
jgi:uncharacterized protein YbjT (DUF2867 family)